MLVLIVEDEAAIRSAETIYLGNAGFSVIEAVDGAGAISACQRHQPDVVVLDLNLPDMNGVDVCKAIRASSAVPIIITTARTTDADELQGLDTGADDYIKKPFDLRLLVARIHTVLRRTNAIKLSVGPFRLDVTSQNATKDGEPLVLSTTLFTILHALASRPGVILSRQQLLELVHYSRPTANEIYDRTIDAHIKLLRKAVETNPARPQYIQTALRKGYYFKENL